MEQWANEEQAWVVVSQDSLCPPLIAPVFWEELVSLLMCWSLPDLSRHSCGHRRVTNGGSVLELVHTCELAVPESPCRGFQHYTDPRQPCGSRHATSCSDLCSSNWSLQTLLPIRNPSKMLYKYQFLIWCESTTVVSVVICLTASS